MAKGGDVTVRETGAVVVMCMMTGAVDLQFLDFGTSQIPRKEDTNMKKRGLVTVLAGLCMVIVLVTSPCIASDKKDVIKIGGLYCLTGFGSANETQCYLGAKIAEEWINEQGGISINGKPYMIELVAEDVKGTADGAAAAANKLHYDHKVKFVTGTVVPFMLQAAGTVLEPAKVIRSVLYNCGLPSEYGPQSPYMFVSQGATIEGMFSSLAYVKEAYPDVKNIAVIAPDDGAVPTQEKIFHKRAESLGLKLSPNFVRWALNTQDFTPVVTKALATKPDAVAFVNGWPQATGSMIKIAREMGYDKLMFGGNYDDLYVIRDIVGKEGSDKVFMHVLVHDSPEMTPMIKELVRRVKQKEGKITAALYNAWGFQGVWVLAQAIQKAQSLDPTAVKDAWEKMDAIKTVYGPGKMGGLKTYGINHTVCHPLPIAELVNGEVKWVKWVDVYSP